MARDPAGQWVKGSSGNAQGRPRGIKEKAPRGLIGKIVAAVVEEPDTAKAIAKALRGALSRERTVTSALETAGKFTKEIGPSAEGLGNRPIIVNWISNVNPHALAGARKRKALRSEPEDGA